MYYRLVVHFPEHGVISTDSGDASSNAHRPKNLNPASTITNKANRMFLIRMFGRHKESGANQSVAYAKIQDSLDSALTSVFSEDGKKAVLYYMTQNYSLSLEQASRDPKKLEAALTDLLGEIGWKVVKGKILERLYGPGSGMESLSTGVPSLTEAFGFVRSIRAGFANASIGF